MFNLFENESVTNDFQFILDSAGKDITLNNESARAVITNTKLNVFTDFDDRHIATLTRIKRGDLIQWNNNNWFIYNEIAEPRHSKYKGIMRKCNHTIKFILNGNLYSFPSIISSKTHSVNFGNVPLAEGKIMVTMQDNQLTRLIELNKRFILSNSQPYKIVGVDRTMVGLLTFTADVDLIKASDDLENGIADIDQIDIYHIEVEPTLIINEGSSQQLNFTTYKNRDIVSFPVTFASSDEGIITVDSNGLITAYNEGTATITITKADDESVFANIDITVETNIIVYSIVITGNKTIEENETLSYIAKVFENGIETNEIVTWSISNNNAQIINVNGNSCTLKGLKIGQVDLVAKWGIYEEVKSIDIESDDWW